MDWRAVATENEHWSVAVTLFPPKTVSLLHTQKKQHKPPKVVLIHSVYTMTPFQLWYIVEVAKDICIDWFQFCCPALEFFFMGYCQSKRDIRVD